MKLSEAIALLQESLDRLGDVDIYEAPGEEGYTVTTARLSVDPIELGEDISMSQCGHFMFNYKSPKESGANAVIVIVS